MPPLPYVKRIPGLDYAALEPAYTDARVWDNFDPRYLTLCSPDPQAIRPPDEKVNVLMVTLPTNFKVAKFDDEKGTAILRQLEKEIDAVRFDPGDGTKIELPVKLRVHDFDLRAARQMVDAARRQLPLRHQGRHADRAGGGAHRHRDLALGLQFRVRSVRQARRHAGRPRAVREIRRRGAIAGASGLGRARACRTARRTSSAPTSWCSSSPGRRA